MTISGAFSDGDAISFADAMVEVDLLADDTWAPIDSWATQVDVSGEDVPSTETYPFSGTAVVFVGTKSPVEVTIIAIYTEGSTDPFQNIRDRFEAANGPVMEVRFTPGGSAAGNFRFTTSGGKLTACPPAVGAGDASSATVFAFTIRANSLGRDTIS